MGSLSLLFILLFYTAIAPWSWVWRFWLGTALAGSILTAVISQTTSFFDAWGQGNIMIGSLYVGLFVVPLATVLALRWSWRVIHRLLESKRLDGSAG